MIYESPNDVHSTRNTTTLAATTTITTTNARQRHGVSKNAIHHDYVMHASVSGEPVAEQCIQSPYSVSTTAIYRWRYHSCPATSNAIAHNATQLHLIKSITSLKFNACLLGWVTERLNDGGEQTERWLWLRRQRLRSPLACNDVHENMLAALYKIYIGFEVVSPWACQMELAASGNSLYWSRPDIEDRSRQ